MRPLWQVDYSWEGFQWIVPDDNKQSVIAFLRRDAKGKMLLVVCNFNPVLRESYSMGVPNPGTYKELINSDDVKYGGAGVKNGSVKSVKGPAAAVHHLFQRSRCPQKGRKARQGRNCRSSQTRKGSQACGHQNCRPQKAHSQTRGNKTGC